MAGWIQNALSKAANVATKTSGAVSRNPAMVQGLTGTTILGGAGASLINGKPKPSNPVSAGAGTTGLTGGINGGQTGGGLSAEDILARYYQAQNDPALSYLTGGPNLGLINQLKADSARRLELYKTNRADAENLYGQLTGKVEQLGTQMGQGYSGAITGSQERQTTEQTRMSDQLAAQEQRRAAAAQELGVGAENVATDYGSRERANEAMNMLGQSSTSWQNLLSSMQQSAAERNANMQTAIGGDKLQTVLGMKQQYDAIADQIAQQIAAERSKTATRKLNELGKMMTQGYLGQLKDLTFGDGTSTNKFMQADKTANDYLAQVLGTNPYEYPGGPNAFKAAQFRRLVGKYGAGKMNAGTKLAPADNAIMEAYGWNMNDLAPYQYAELVGGGQGG
jgi:hypothetical protein